MSREKRFRICFQNIQPNKTSNKSSQMNTLKERKSIMVPFWFKTLTVFLLLFLYAAPKQCSTFFGNRKSIIVPFWFKTLTFLCVFAAQLAFCGELLDICMTLPYTDFLPPTFPIHVVIKVNIVKRWSCVAWYLRAESGVFCFTYLLSSHSFSASDISHPRCDPGKHCQMVVLCLLVL